MALELSPEQIKLLEEMAGTFFTWRECATALEIETSSFVNEMKKPSSIVYKTYHAALIKNNLKLRKGILDLAQRGSGPAQQQMIKIVDATNAANK